MDPDTQKIWGWIIAGIVIALVLTFVFRRGEPTADVLCCGDAQTNSAKA